MQHTNLTTSLFISSLTFLVDIAVVLTGLILSSYYLPLTLFNRAQHSGDFWHNSKRLLNA